MGLGPVLHMPLSTGGGGRGFWVLSFRGPLPTNDLEILSQPQGSADRDSIMLTGLHISSSPHRLGPFSPCSSPKTQCTPCPVHPRVPEPLCLAFQHSIYSGILVLLRAQLHPKNTFSI